VPDVSQLAMGGAMQFAQSVDAAFELLQLFFREGKRSLILSQHLIYPSSIRASDECVSDLIGTRQCGRRPL